MGLSYGGAGRPLHPWMALPSQFTALTTVNMNNQDLRNDLFYSMDMTPTHLSFDPSATLLRLSLDFSYFMDMTPTPLASIPVQLSLDFPSFPFSCSKRTIGAK